MLWKGVGKTPAELAKLLNTLPRDPSVPGSYSLIPVHAWSMTVKDVFDTAQLLNKDVEVVTPTEFVRRVKANVCRTTL